MACSTTQRPPLFSPGLTPQHPPLLHTPVRGHIPPLHIKCTTSLPSQGILDMTQVIVVEVMEDIKEEDKSCVPFLHHV
jgi:hypothetical protein